MRGRTRTMRYSTVESDTIKMLVKIKESIIFDYTLDPYPVELVHGDVLPYLRDNLVNEVLNGL